PTGAWLTREAWNVICSICVTHNLAAIVDEVFADYAIDQPADTLTTVAGQPPMPTFVISGLAKVAALPQMKLGWIAVGGPPASRGAALDGLELIADTFLSVSTPVQLALPALLEARHELQAQILSRLRFNLATLAAAVDGSAAGVLPVEGGWYAIVRMPGRHNDEEWALRLLTEQDVLMHPGFLFDFDEDHCLVCSLLTPQSEFAAGVARLVDLIAAD
ncbi:MAG: pyridoxal phosphate-dependent aminotransferase, partial [Lentisphaeria bacterium]|nr:pyridoxal phosphate-dependent aminotransferase [Lentisphaeria bacterium]